MSSTVLTIEELEAMLDRAAKRGATQALAAIGLHDDTAAKDIHEMRSLLDAWRDTRRSIWSTAIRISTASVLIFIAGAVWMNMGK
jgi:2-iminoacetate synthase ThiH|tara:strand:+ start:19 stop:273 length:255 start_codon:yes stop_codon:yes gene_type:complete